MFFQWCVRHIFRPDLILTSRTLSSLSKIWTSSCRIPSGEMGSSMHSESLPLVQQTSDDGDAWFWQYVSSICRCWSPELHQRFVRALQQLGGSQGSSNFWSYTCHLLLVASFPQFLLPLCIDILCFHHHEGLLIWVVACAMLPFPHVIVAGCTKGFIWKKPLK